MKKILLATTALALSAGIANAQAVSISGEGRMGIMARNAGVWTWTQENRLQFNFSVSVQGDHGLTFGAYSRARIQASATNTFGESRVWVESNGFRLTFGNNDGAFRGAGVSHGYAGGCGVGYEGGQQCGDSAGLLSVTQAHNSTGQHNNVVTGLPGTGRARIDYTMGDTRVALSHDRNGSTEFGVRSSFDAFTVALGYTNNGGAASAFQSVWALSGHYNGGSWGVGAVVANGNGVTNYSLSGNAQLGGGNLYGYVGRVGGANTYGLSYGYGLGGGATATIGAERVGTVTTASVGVAFGF